MVIKADALGKNIISGLAVQDGIIALYRYQDDFTADTRSRYKISGSSTDWVNEFGLVDSLVDTSMVTVQTRPAPSLLLETRDNDGLTISMDVTPTVKGVVSLEIWPLRLWPTSGRFNLDISETDQRRISYALAGSDYKLDTAKFFDGATLKVPGGRPYFSSISQTDIYKPFEVIPTSEQRWWPVRLLFRPDYVAGSLDGSVCREIDDPERRPIAVRRIQINIGQLETYLRALKFKALLGEAVSAPLTLNGTRWAGVAWDGDAPEKTRIGLQVRGAATAEGLTAAAWSGTDAADPYFLKPGPVPAALADMKFLQIRVLLKAEQDAAFDATPVVRSVTVTREGGST
ncbi:MAG: hypothetical protein ABIF71_05590 [Planctomycetota bacterium]